jgi:hypothetical protein
VNLQDEIKKAKELLSQLENKQAVELAKPKSKRILETGLCYYVDNSGRTSSSCLYHPEYFINNDNAFIDEASAQIQAQRNTLVYRMRVAALESPVDWGKYQDKYYPCWYLTDNSLDFETARLFRTSQLPHFACKEKLREFMENLSTDEQKLLICGVE